jgi:hypothetical protein
MRLVPVKQRQQIKQIRDAPNDPRMRMLMHRLDELPRPPRPFAPPIRGMYQCSAKACRWVSLKGAR